MSFLKRPSLTLSERRKRNIYNPYGMRDVIQTYAGRSYEEVLEEHRKKREKQEE